MYIILNNKMENVYRFIGHCLIFVTFGYETFAIPVSPDEYQPSNIKSMDTDVRDSIGLQLLEGTLWFCTNESDTTITTTAFVFHNYSKSCVHDNLWLFSN